MVSEKDARSLRQRVGGVARRTPGVKEVMRVRDERNSLNQLRREWTAEGGKSTLRAQRDRIAAQRERLRGVRIEARANRMRLGRLEEAAAWLDHDAQTTGERPAAGLKARSAAAAFTEALSRGQSPETALVDYAQALATLPPYPYRFRLPALVAQLADMPGIGAGASAALVIHGHYTRHAAYALHHLDECGDDAPRLIPVEYAQIRLANDPSMAPAVLDAVAAAGTATPTQWLDVLSAISATGDIATLTRATEQLASQASDWNEDDRAVFDRFVEYAQIHADPKPPAAADVHFGVIGYRRPDVRLSSKNLGDYTQTISALSHVVRRSGLRFVGEPNMVAAVESLRQRVRPELVLDGDDATVGLVEVNRDDSTLDIIPPRTWMIGFGWYIHPNALGGYGLPFHENIRPIFLSFHVNRREMLSDDALDYLRRYAPIGCRDWYTADMLTRLGVPAFFSGCLTTTVDTYFPPQAPVNGPRAYVDTRPDDRTEVLTQVYDEVRFRSPADNLRAALKLLDEYRSTYSALTTSRLHCYIPATSIGIPTEFRPHRAYDGRFEGLTDEYADLDAIRTRIRTTLLEPVLTAIFAGKDEEDVYALWRALTEPMVAADTAARATAYEWPTSALDVPAQVAAIRSQAWTAGPDLGGTSGVVDLCFVLDKNYVNQLYTVLNQILANTDRPLRLWPLVRGFEQADYEAFAKAFPEVQVTFLPCDDVDYGAISNREHRISISTMDRLLLPELLGELDKVLYLDLDLLPLADLGELFDIDLGDAPLAARSSFTTNSMGGLGGFNDMARGYFGHTREGWRLLNLAHRRAGTGDIGFNAGVLLLSLARLRKDEFLKQYCGFAEEFGLNDQHVINLYAGSSYLPLEKRWNSWPDRDVLEDPALVHWVGPMKPWGELAVAYKDRWEQAEADMRAQRGGIAAPPQPVVELDPDADTTVFAP